MREIGQEVGLKCSSSVVYQLRWLKEEGLLSRDCYRTRLLRMP